MRRQPFLLVCVCLFCLAVPLAAEAGGPAGREAPVQALAQIDAKGTLAVTRIRSLCSHGPGSTGHDVVELRGPDKGGKDTIAVKAKVTIMAIARVELPASSVEAHTVSGAPIDAAKLAELLAKERAVLIAVDGKKIDPFHLQLYKEDTIVLVPPTMGRFWSHDFGTDADAHPIVMPIAPPKKMPDGPKEFLPRPEKILPPEKVDDRKPKEPESCEGEKKEDGDAPAPGGIAALLGLRDKFPPGPVPEVNEVIAARGEIQVVRRVIENVPATMRVVERVTEKVPVIEAFEVIVDGKREVRKRTVFVPQVRDVEKEVTIFRPVTTETRQTFRRDAVQAFTVSKEGKLEAIDSTRLPNLLVKVTPVLTIANADIDPRHVTLLRPGTILMVLPAPPAAEPKLRE